MLKFVCIGVLASHFAPKKFGLQDIRQPKLSTAAGFVKRLHDLAGDSMFDDHCTI